MRNRILLFVLIGINFQVFLTRSVFAQDLCRTKNLSNEQYEKAKSYIMSSKKARVLTNDVKWVPIKVNILRRTNGTFDVGKEVTLDNINEALAYANKKFHTSGIQFFILGSESFEEHYQVKDDFLYNGIYDSGNLMEQQLCNNPGGTSRDNPKALNMYIVANINGGSGGYAYYPTDDITQYTRIFINATNTSSSARHSLKYTITHELGHSFFLMHTFSIDGNRRGGFSGKELVNRNITNCEFIGDLFCETDADPFDPEITLPFGGVSITKSGSTLSYTGNLKDSENNLYTPPLYNPMSYYYYYFKNENCDKYNFVLKQSELMANYYDVRKGWTINNLSISPPNQPVPTNLNIDARPFVTNVSWTDNSLIESGYFIERSTSPISNFICVGYVSPSVDFFQDSPPHGAVYYYKVRASNSTSYSEVKSTLCTNSVDVSLFNNSIPLNQKDTWYKTYQWKAIKWNIIDKNKIGLVTVGEAAKSIILAAKAIWDSKYATLPKPCNDSNEYAEFVQEMKNIGALGNDITPNDILTMDILSDMIYKVILDAGTTSNSPLPQKYIKENLNYSGTAKAKKLAKVFTYRFTGNINRTTGIAIPKPEFLLTNKTILDRSTFWKVLTGAYETKYYIVKGQLRQSRQNNESAINSGDIEDIAIIGNNLEYSDDVPDGSPTLKVTGVSEIIQSGAQWWIDMTPTGFGNNVQFYWTVEGASQGARLDPFPGSANYQKIYFTAPTVTTETIVNMVIYAASEDGKAVEIYKEFKVVPIPNNGCITLLTPNISFDRVAGSFTSTKACNISNGSTSNMATLNTTITGPNAINFYVTPTNTTLSSGSQMSFTVSCDASTVGTYTASLEITQTGLSGCPTKITVPLLANVTAAPTATDVQWGEPLSGAIFYSGSNVPTGSNYAWVTNNYTIGTEFMYSLDGSVWQPLVACTTNPILNPSIFPDGVFTKKGRLRARRKDCYSGYVATGWVESPYFTIMPVPNPNINIVLPNGEEELKGGQLYDIQWSGSSTTPVSLLYSLDGGNTFPYTIVSNTNASLGKYTWVIPIFPGYEGSVKIKIMSGSYFDVSDAKFAIKPPMFFNPNVVQGCDNKGFLSINAGGGKGPLSYLITPGNYTINEISGLNAGTYTIKITDLTGEAIQTSINIPAYTNRDFSFTKTDASCNSKDGSILITGFSNGFIPDKIVYYKNEVYMGSFNGEVHNLEPGKYLIYASVFMPVFGYSCGVQKEIIINPDINFNVSSIIHDASCGQSDGSIKLLTNTSANFLWAINNSTSNIISNINQGTYFVSVTNPLTNCSLDLSYDVGYKPNFNISQNIAITGARSGMAVLNGRLYFRTNYIHPNTIKIDTLSTTAFQLGNAYNITQFGSDYRIFNLVNLNIEPILNWYSPIFIYRDINFPSADKVGAYNSLGQLYPIYENIYNNSVTFMGLIPQGYAINNNNRNQFYKLQQNNLINQSLPTNYTAKKLLVYGNDLLVAANNNTSNLGKVFAYENNALNEQIANSFSTQHYVRDIYGISAFHPLFVGTQDLQNSKFYIEVYSLVNGGYAYLDKIEIPENFFSTTEGSSMIADSKYLYVLTASSKIAVIDWKRKILVKTLDLGMYIETLGFDNLSKRIFCYDGNGNLKYFTINDAAPKVSLSKVDVGCTPTGSISLSVPQDMSLTYSWSNGSISKDIFNLTAGDYTVSISQANGLCPLSLSDRIKNISPTPASISIPANKTSFCVGESVQLIANQGMALTYQWQKDGVDITDATQQTYYVTNTGSYQVKVKNSTGCEATSTSVAMTENALPTASITPLSSTTICEGNTVTLRANAATNQSYVWLKDDAVVQGQTNQDYVANSAGNYQVITILNGCSNISSTTNVTVNTLPTAPTISSTTINNGQTATLTATGCTGTITWYANATGGTGLTTGTNYTTPTLTTNTTYYASCTVSSCESSRGSGTVTVNGCTPPTAPNFPNQPTLGSAGTFSLNYSTMCSGGTLKWYDALTGGNLLNTGSTYTTPVLYGATSYYISCTINDCESTRGQLTINYSPLPCVGNQNSSGNFGTYNVQTNGTVISTSTIMSGARTNFFAGQSVTLNPGFKTSTSSIFRAEIQNCVSNSGLIAYYPFNGNVNDESGNLKHGTNNGASLTTDRFGNFQKAYYFDGVSNWINTPLVQSNLTEYTISAWVKPEFTASQEYVILQNRGASPGSGKGFALHYQNSSNRWGFALDGDATYIGKQAPYANNTNWVHIVATWSAGSAISFSPLQFNIYINGVLQSSAVSQNIGTATIPSIPAGTSAIGRSEAWNSYFKGKIDDLRIYNRALNATEVKSIYNFER